MKDVQELNQVSKHSYFASMVETRRFFIQTTQCFSPYGKTSVENVHSVTQLNRVKNMISVKIPHFPLFMHQNTLLLQYLFRSKSGYSMRGFLDVAGPPKLEVVSPTTSM